MTHTFVILPRVYGYFNIPSATLKYRDTPTGNVEVLFCPSALLSSYLSQILNTLLSLFRPLFCILLIILVDHSFLHPRVRSD